MESGNHDVHRSPELLSVLAYFPILPQEYTQHHKTNKDKPFLFATIMPWCHWGDCHWGDLIDCLKDLRTEYDSYKRLGCILPLLTQVLEVVEILTKKPGILFFLDKDRWHILVADFGVARHVVDGTKITAGPLQTTKVSKYQQECRNMLNSLRKVWQ